MLFKQLINQNQLFSQSQNLKLIKMQVEKKFQTGLNQNSPQFIKKSAQQKSQERRSRDQEGPYNNQPEQQMGLLQQFKQQMMKAWQPVPTLTKTIIMFFFLSALFLGIGITMLILSQDLSQASFRYDNICSINSSQICSQIFTVPQTLSSPVFVYYQLHNFYQNHRLYASSYSYDQLTGKQISESTAQANCNPIVYNKNLYVNQSFTGKPLDPNQVAIPCGLIAFTVFNDTFTLNSPSGQQISILSDGIAWSTDIKKYKNVNPDKMWLDVTNERFMNWMRIAAMSDFRKLWGRIEGSLPPGNYTLNIKNNYNLSAVKGQKYFVVSTSNFFGSKSNFLSISYISVGSVCCLMGFLFLMRKLSKKSKII